MGVAMVVEGCGWVCGGGFFFFFNMSCGELVVVVAVDDGWLWRWKALTRLVVLVEVAVGLANERDHRKRDIGKKTERRKK